MSFVDVPQPKRKGKVASEAKRLAQKVKDKMTGKSSSDKSSSDKNATLDEGKKRSK